MLKTTSGLIAGTVFGAGLAASGMTNTAKVIGFLDLFGNWDADLAFVMGSAVITAMIGFKIVLKGIKPLFADIFTLPTSTEVDLKMLVGAGLFGVGWGLYGYCPGPAVASLVYLSPITFGFTGSMLVGMVIANYLSQRFASKSA